MNAGTSHRTRVLSLSPQTIAYLSSISEPVSVGLSRPKPRTVFSGPIHHHEVAHESSGGSDFRPRHPSTAREYDITDMGVVLQQGDRQIQVVSPYSEGAFRLALINLLSEETHYTFASVPATENLH